MVIQEVNMTTTNEVMSQERLDGYIAGAAKASDYEEGFGLRRCDLSQRRRSGSGARGSGSRCPRHCARYWLVLGVQHYSLRQGGLARPASGPKGPDS